MEKKRQTNLRLSVSQALLDTDAETWDQTDFSL